MVVDDFKFNVDALEILIVLSIDGANPPLISIANNGQQAVDLVKARIEDPKQ